MRGCISGGWPASSNPVPTLPPMSPRPHQDEPQWVHVYGYGFVDTPSVACKFIAPHGSIVVRGQNVVFLRSTEIMCLQPVTGMPFVDPSVLEVAVDGYVFSESKVHDPESSPCPMCAPWGTTTTSRHATRGCRQDAGGFMAFEVLQGSLRNLDSCQLFVAAILRPKGAKWGKGHL